MSVQANDRWLVKPSPNPTAGTALIALSFAGGGASAFRSWPKRLPIDTELLCVELPGRESRLREPPIGDLSRVIDALREALPSALAGRRFALFGHSLGALLAFELARALRDDGLGEPAFIIASGREAPTRREPGRQMHALVDDEFVDEMISRYDGIPKILLDEPELLELFLPAMKADMRLTETYVYRPAARFTCPIHVLTGNQDTRLTRDLLLPWAEETTGDAPLTYFPGGHFFIRDSQADVLAYVRDALNEMPADVAQSRTELSDT